MDEPHQRVEQLGCSDLRQRPIRSCLSRSTFKFQEDEILMVMCLRVSLCTTFNYLLLISDHLFVSCAVSSLCEGGCKDKTYYAEPERGNPRGIIHAPLTVPTYPGICASILMCVYVCVSCFVSVCLVLCVCVCLLGSWSFLRPCVTICRWAHRDQGEIAFCSERSAQFYNCESKNCLPTCLSDLVPDLFHRYEFSSNICFSLCERPFFRLERGHLGE